MNGSTSSAHRRHPSLEDKILSHLRSSSSNIQKSALTRKEIQKELITNDVVTLAFSSSSSSSSADVTKKDVKRTLKRLVKRGDIVKDGKKYKLMPSRSDDDESNSDDDSSRSESASVANNELDEELGEETPAPFVPIAERIRQTAQTKQSDEHPISKQQMDLDEEIRRLEAELAKSDDEDDDEESDDDDSNDDYAIDGNTTSKADGIICLSSVADERIVPLPQGALPQNKRRTLKNIDSGDAEPTKSKKHKNHSSTSKEGHTISEGLTDAVNELLKSYIPSSQLKKPFYCRVCQHQAETESDFLSHKQSKFHKGAVQQEKKRTYCKLCRKQLTSIVQMEEHLKSRPHREKMDFVKSKQSGGSRSRAHGRDASGKQWC